LALAVRIEKGQRMETLNVAVVGCGIFGEVVSDSFAGYHGCRLTSVCDLDEKRAKKLAAKHGCECTTSVAEIAADERIEAVAVATPDFAHRDVCVALARAGKHIFVEKPLATSVTDAEAIVLAVRKAGVTCMVDFHNRYNPAIAAIKDRLASGEIGRPQAIFIRLSDRIEVATKWFNWASKSGPEWFLGSHIADLACWLFDAQPTRVFADGRKEVLASRGIDCYDTVQIHLSFPGGMATLETSWIMPEAWPMICDFSVSVQATAGRADANLTSHGVLVAGQRVEYPMILGKTPVAGQDFGFFKLPVRAFVDAVLAGEPAPIDVADGLKNVRIIEAAVKSIETGKAVGLNR
jgi:predicted dehydrogenase